jgi:hypothetical protein
MAVDGAPATPSAFYKMLAVPDAQELILSETQELPAVEVRFQDALHHTLAAEVRAVEPVPGFRASIKVRAENHCLPPDMSVALARSWCTTYLSHLPHGFCAGCMLNDAFQSGTSHRSC